MLTTDYRYLYYLHFEDISKTSAELEQALGDYCIWVNPTLPGAFEIASNASHSKMKHAVKTIWPGETLFFALIRDATFIIRKDSISPEVP